MANVDMCEHDWPGSGCRECAEKYGWKKAPKKEKKDANPR